MHWVFIAMHGLSLIMVGQDYALVAMHRLLTAGASLLLQSTGCGVRRLQ